MKYQDLILSKFEHLNKEPRDFQPGVINDILVSFIDDKKPNVILSAETGAGKSIIGAVVALCMDDLLGKDYCSTICMHTNSLVDQYSETFSNYDDDQFFHVKGASNYTCPALEAMSDIESASAEDCFIKTADTFQKEEYCRKCEYRESRVKASKTRNLITNYSYFFSKSMSRQPLATAERPLVIFDEAHVLNDVYCSHFTIEVSEKNLMRQVGEITRYFPKEAKSQIDELNSIIKQFKEKEVYDYNYIDICKRIAKIYFEITFIITKNATGLPINELIKMEKIGRKYSNHHNNIKTFLTSMFEHVFEFDEEKNVMTIKPIFMNGMEMNFGGTYNLYMSATISKDFMCETLGLNPDETVFIKSPPVFDPENKSIIFIPLGKMNYSTMSDPKFMDKLYKTCKEIVEYHSSEGKKGLILVPSFKLTNDIRKHLMSLDKRLKIFAHVQGTSLNELIEEYKTCNAPAVLISPSIYEGLDFPDDDARYQIIVKAPYASLADKRIKKICSDYPKIYRLTTLMKIIQGIGRGVRNEKDWCDTYILDKSAQELFDSYLNVWKDQFVKE